MEAHTEIAVSPEVGFPPEVVAKVNAGKVRFEGGDGSSYGSAVAIVGTADQREWGPAEHLWIARKHGAQGRDWWRLQQSVLERNGRHYELLIVQVAGERFSRTYYFDITDLFGRDEAPGASSENPGR